MTSYFYAMGPFGQNQLDVVHGRVPQVSASVGGEVCFPGLPCTECRWLIICVVLNYTKLVEFSGLLPRPT